MQISSKSSKPRCKNKLLKCIFLTQKLKSISTYMKNKPLSLPYILLYKSHASGKRWTGYFPSALKTFRMSLGSQMNVKEEEPGPNASENMGPNCLWRESTYKWSFGPPPAVIKSNMVPIRGKPFGRGRVFVAVFCEKRLTDWLNRHDKTSIL